MKPSWRPEMGASLLEYHLQSGLVPHRRRRAAPPTSQGCRIRRGHHLTPGCGVRGELCLAPGLSNEGTAPPGYRAAGFGEGSRMVTFPRSPTTRAPGTSPDPRRVARTPRVSAHTASWGLPALPAPKQQPARPASFRRAEKRGRRASGPPPRPWRAQPACASIFPTRARRPRLCEVTRRPPRQSQRSHLTWSLPGCPRSPDPGTCRPLLGVSLPAAPRFPPSLAQPEARSPVLIG